MEKSTNAPRKLSMKPCHMATMTPYKTNKNNLQSIFFSQARWEKFGPAPGGTEPTEKSYLNKTYQDITYIHPDKISPDCSRLLQWVKLNLVSKNNVMPARRRAHCASLFLPEETHASGSKQ